jgi:tRNA(adenine34) deaminase
VAGVIGCGRQGSAAGVGGVAGAALCSGVVGEGGAGTVAAVSDAPLPGQLDSPAGPAADEEAMEIALAEARAALAHGDVPVGAVAVGAGGKVLSRRHNERELRSDPTAHAEMLALQDAATALGTWRLEGMTLVASLEPCPMCAGALVAARVARVVFGAADPKGGACGSLYNLCVDPRLNHEVDVVPGVRSEECSELLAAFFAGRRSR